MIKIITSWLISIRRKLPVIYQSVNAECGLACAAMLSSYWGANVDIQAVRDRGNHSTFGLTLGALREVLHGLQLTTRVVQVDPSLLARVRTPAILHWGIGHYVVLKEVHNQHIVIHDPDRGKLRIVMDEVNKKLSGWAIEAIPNEKFKATTLKATVNWTSWLGFRRRWALGIVGVFILSLISQLLVISMPYYLQVLVDRVIPSFEITLLPNLAILFGALVVIDFLVRVLQVQLANVIGIAVGTTFGNKVFDHLLNLPLGYFEGRSLTDIASRFDSLDEIRRTVLEDVPGALLASLLFALSGLAILRFADELLICVLFFLGTYLLIRAALFSRHHQLLADAFYLRSREATTLLETLQSILPIKASSAESNRQRTWSKTFFQAGAASLHYNIARARMDFVRESITGLETVVSVYIAAHLMMAGDMTIGMLVGFIAYKRLFTTSAISLIETGFRLKSTTVHLTRLKDIASAKRETSASTAISLGPLEKLTLTAVTHRYQGAQRNTFEPVNLSIQRGDRLAIIGPSGCGKSTLIKIILGLNEGAGHISVNDVTLSPAERKSLLEKTGVIFQGDKLLAGSLLENIAFFDPMPDRQRAREAAQLACILDDLESLPLGLETPIQDDFTILSAGQKQRILLARALYREPELLVLDEGTANLDEALEQRILANIKHQGITVIHATHRSQVISDATQVIRLS